MLIVLSPLLVNHLQERERGGSKEKKTITREKSSEYENVRLIQISEFLHEAQHGNIYSGVIISIKTVLVLEQIF